MKVAVFGGTGFVGSYIIDELIASNFSPKTLVRKGSESKLVRDCEIVHGDISDSDAVRETIAGVDSIIYNIGIIREFPSSGITYKKLHYDGVLLCIKLAEEMNVSRFILMSANGVKEGGTGYQHFKYMAEQELQSSKLEWTIFRPSLIFGKPYQNLHKEFCSQLRDEMLSLPIPAPLFYRGIFPIKAGLFSMSPVHAKNISQFFVKSLTMDKTIGKIYNIGGNEHFTWKDIIHNIAIASNKLTWKIPAPVFVVNILAKILDRYKWFPVTQDQLVMLLEGNVVEEQYFKEFDIEPINFNKETLVYLMK